MPHRLHLDDFPKAFADVVATSTGNVVELVQSTEWCQRLLTAFRSLEFHAKDTPMTSNAITMAPVPDVEMGNATGPTDIHLLPEVVMENDSPLADESSALVHNATSPAILATAPCRPESRPERNRAAATSTNDVMPPDVAMTDGTAQVAESVIRDTPEAQAIASNLSFSAKEALFTAATAPEQDQGPAAFASTRKVGPRATKAPTKNTSGRDSESAVDSMPDTIAVALERNTTSSVVRKPLPAASRVEITQPGPTCPTPDSTAMCEGVFSPDRPEMLSWSLLTQSLREDNRRIEEFADMAARAMTSVADATNRINRIQSVIGERDRAFSGLYESLEILVTARYSVTKAMNEDLDQLTAELNHHKKVLELSSRDLQIAAERREMFSNLAYMEQELRATIINSCLECRTYDELGTTLAHKLVCTGLLRLGKYILII